MKTIIFAAGLVGAAFGAQAAQSPAECAETANIFNIAADVRDSGRSPEVALREVMRISSKKDAGEENLRKQLVNIVYFEPAYSDPGTVLSQRIYANCVKQQPAYKPLQ
jgi:hypothetical protein